MRSKHLICANTVHEWPFVIIAFLYAFWIHTTRFAPISPMHWSPPLEILLWRLCDMKTKRLIMDFKSEDNSSRSDGKSLHVELFRPTLSTALFNTLYTAGAHIYLSSLRWPLVWFMGVRTWYIAVSCMVYDIAQNCKSVEFWTKHN